MAFRLTVILALVIYLTMRFAGGPVPEPAPEITAVPETSAPPEPETVAVPATEEPAPEPAPQAVTLAPPQELAPALEDPDDAQSLTAVPDGIVSPEEALPRGVGVGAGGGLGLSNALDLRAQVNAALEDAREEPERPSLADLARPGGGQPAEPLLETGADNPTADPTGSALAKVTAVSVNLRDGPSTLNLVVGRVSAGDVLDIRGEFSGGWVAVGHPETGATVYVSGQFLDRLN